MEYRIILRNGYVHLGDDERDGAEMLWSAAVDEAELPKGWIWLAGLYVRGSEVAAIQMVPVAT
jgi:hypothetical protein